MIAINYTELRKSLKKNLDLACESHETVVIQRPNEKSVVLVSLEDYNSMVETSYLLGTKTNAERLMASIAQAEKGKKLKKFDPTA
jgi:antitoxin YefM